MNDQQRKGLFFSVILVLIMLCSGLSVHAQSISPNSKTPGRQFTKKEKRQMRKAEKKRRKFLEEAQKQSQGRTYDQAIFEAQERQKQNAEKYARMEREMKKPQYSDPTYFGHKRKPKKRKPGKKKFCKECGMWH